MSMLQAEWIVPNSEDGYRKGKNSYIWDHVEDLWYNIIYGDQSASNSLERNVRIIIGRITADESFRIERNHDPGVIVMAKDFDINNLSCLTLDNISY